MIVKDLLNQDKNSRYLLEKVLNKSYEDIIINDNYKLSIDEEKAFKILFGQLEQGVPLEYLTNKKNFLGKDFFVDEKVLIPRDETEELVIYTKMMLNKLNITPNKILDIGTGSGVIAISLKNLYPDSYVKGIDISEDALRVAKINSNEVNFIKQDMFIGEDNTYDLIISNPPYIEEGSLLVDKSVKDYEPHLALFSKDDGLYHIKRIIQEHTKFVHIDYLLAFEIGIYQKEKLIPFLEKLELNYEFIKDMNGIDRFLFISKSGKNQESMIK